MKNIIVLTVVLLVGGYFASKFVLHNKVASGIDAAVAMAAPFAQIEYAGVSSTMRGELTIDGIKASIPGFEDDIYIARLGIDTPSYFTLLGLADIAENLHDPDEIFPDYFGVLVEGVRMKVDADYMQSLYRQRLSALNVDDAGTPANSCVGKYGYSPEALLALGYTEQTASFSAHFRRGRGSYSVSVASRIDDMWNVGADFELAGDMVSEISRGSRYRPKLTSMRIEYRDDSLNRRAQKYCSDLGLSDEQIFAAQMDALEYVGGEYGIEFDDYVIGPYAEFLGGKSTLVITAKPSEPISITQISLYKPSDVPALLDLTAEAF